MIKETINRFHFCCGLGFKQGKDAQLNQGTTNQQDVQFRLGGDL